jgi:solute carrier family 25 carnitine/acylcarnitine transporter 20/29
LINLTILNSLSFGAFAQFKEGLRSFNQTIGLDRELTHAQYFIAGGATGSIAGVLSTPFEMLKVTMQLDNITTKKFRSSWHGAKTIVREHGIKMLYTGYTVNTFREIIFCGAYFGAYEFLKKFLSEKLCAVDAQSQKISPWVIMLSGGLSGMCGWVSSFPLDSIKANIQGKALVSTKTTILDAAREIWKAKGIGGFYSGIGPSVTRAFIVSSTRFSAFEFAMKMLSLAEDKHK